MMLYTICKKIKNFFPAGASKHGRWTVVNGAIDGVAEVGQFYLIEGSIRNDGIHICGQEHLKEETFDGYITILAIPDDFLLLVNEIEAFVEDEKPSAYTSESFGGYSYTRATGAGGQAASWPEVFRSRLNAWRKI